MFIAHKAGFEADLPLISSEETMSYLSVLKVILFAVLLLAQNN